MSFEIAVEKFEEIPSHRRNGGTATKSGSALLTPLRKLTAGEKLVIHVKPKDEEDFKKKVRNISGRIHQPGALAFKPTLRSDKEEGVVEIYRARGSDYAKDAQGNLILNEKKQPITEAQLAADTTN